MDIVVVLLFLSILPLYFLLAKRFSKRVPPGSFGFPIIGQSFSFLSAMRQNTAEKWLRERIRKYGPVSKMNIFVTPSVFISGQAANKLVFTSPDNVLSNKQPYSIRRLLGERNIFELTGQEHRRVRGALVSFLKPDVLKQYVGRMDEEIRSEIGSHLGARKQKIQAMSFMKTLTFNIMSSLIAGIEHGPRRYKLKDLLGQTMEGQVAVPINLPFTTFGRSLKAREKLKAIIMEIVCERRAALARQEAIPGQDLLTSFIGLRNEDNSAMLSDEEIVDNVVLAVFAGYETTATLLTFLIRILASDASIHARVLQAGYMESLKMELSRKATWKCNLKQAICLFEKSGFFFLLPSINIGSAEQEEIARSKAPGELLTWDDLLRMKYTWGVALETLRMYTPAILNIRKVMKDFEHEGFLIPKGWQVMVGPFMTHMDDNIFPNALEFDPTRFDKQAPIPPYSFVAFGGGHRICPGNEFAKIESLVAIHNLVTRYTWTLPSPDVPVARNPMPYFNDGLEIQIEPRIASTFGV